MIREGPLESSLRRRRFSICPARVRHRGGLLNRILTRIFVWIPAGALALALPAAGNAGWWSGGREIVVDAGGKGDFTTIQEAIDAARRLIEGFGAETRDVHKQFAARSDSQGFTTVYKLSEDEEAGWLTPYLWVGAVPYLGAPAIALVGSYTEVAEAIIRYKRAGISQFLFLGWPDIEEMAMFGSRVLPIVREQERQK